MTMREKMARAHFQISYSGYGPQGPPPGTWEKVGQDTRDFFFEVADLHLDALLEPSQGVIDAGHGADKLNRRCVRRCWDRMVKAIKEGK